MQAGLFAALVVLLLGTMNGSRAWILLMRATITFLLVAGVLRLLTAAVLQGIRWKADSDEKPKGTSEEEMRDTAEVIKSHSYSPETTEKVAS
jgi:hypothetical protein